MPGSQRRVQGAIARQLSGSKTSAAGADEHEDRKSTRLNSSHSQISYAVFCLKKNDEAVPSFVSGAMAKAGKGLLEGTLQAGTSAVSDKLLDLVGLGGKSAADKGKDTRDYLAAAFPELNAWERAGADFFFNGMVPPGFYNLTQLTKMQL